MNIRTIGATASAVAATAVAGGVASRSGVDSQWYERLRKPGYQPPRQAFPIVWPLLYADIAAVSADTIDRLNDGGEKAAARRFSTALAINLVLNAGWSWLFFGRPRRPGGAAGGLPGVVRVRRRAVHPYLVAQPPLTCPTRPGVRVGGANTGRGWGDGTGGRPRSAGPAAPAGSPAPAHSCTRCFGPVAGQPH